MPWAVLGTRWGHGTRVRSIGLPQAWGGHAPNVSAGRPVSLLGVGVSPCGHWANQAVEGCAAVALARVGHPSQEAQGVSQSGAWCPSRP